MVKFFFEPHRKIVHIEEKHISFYVIPIAIGTIVTYVSIPNLSGQVAVN